MYQVSFGTIRARAKMRGYQGFEEVLIKMVEMLGSNQMRQDLNMITVVTKEEILTTDVWVILDKLDARGLKALIYLVTCIGDISRETLRQYAIDKLSDDDIQILSLAVKHGTFDVAKALDKEKGVEEGEWKF